MALAAIRVVRSSIHRLETGVNDIEGQEFAIGKRWECVTCGEEAMNESLSW